MHIVIEKRIILGLTLSILTGIALIVSIVKYSEGGLVACNLIFYGIVRSSERIFLEMKEVYVAELDVYSGVRTPQERYKMVVTAEEFRTYMFEVSLKNKTSITLYKNCVDSPDEYSSGQEKGYNLENFYKSNTGFRQALLVYLAMIFLLFVALTGLCILDRKMMIDRSRIEISVIDPVDSVTL